jgi:hypothetical protein
MKAILAYLNDHWAIFLFAALAAVAFLYSDKFAEFLYALLRFIIVVIASMALRDLWFKKTLRPYINSLGFANDFQALPQVHKVWISVVVMVALLAVAAACFVHP